MKTFKKNPFKSIRINTDHRRDYRFLGGLLLFLFIATSPLSYYSYTLPKEDLKEWNFLFLNFKVGGDDDFYSVQYYLHALYTKFFLVFFTSIAFLYIPLWWRWSLLAPLTMFLFQFFNVTNKNWHVFDEFSFTYSLIPIVPIIGLLIYSSIKINKKINKLDALDALDEEIEAAIKKSNS